MPFGLRKPRLGIDLGTANIVVNSVGDGIVINEPSVVAVAVNDRRIRAIGNAAREMVGRTPGSLRIMRPMQDGVIAVSYTHLTLPTICSV